MSVSLETVVQYATLGTLLSGLVSLVVWARIYRKQVNAQVVIEISTRYANLFQSFPPQLLLAHLDPGQPLPEHRAEFLVFAIQYASMISFAFHLHERRYLSNDVWGILQGEHQRTVASPWFAREWKLAKIQFSGHAAFIGYMDGLLARSSQ